MPEEFSKSCAHCGVSWMQWATTVQAAFARDRSRPDGFFRICRKCQKAVMRAWYINNQPKQLADVKKWRQDRIDSGEAHLWACAVCDKEFRREARLVRHKDKPTCSQSCAGKLRMAERYAALRVTLPCGNCGTPITHPRSKLKYSPVFYCNRACFDAKRRRKSNEGAGIPPQEKEPNA